MESYDYSQENEPSKDQIFFGLYKFYQKCLFNVKLRGAKEQ